MFGLVIITGLVAIFSSILNWWIEFLKKLKITTTIVFIKKILDIIIGGWKTKLTIFVSGILLGFLSKLALVLGLADIFKQSYPDIVLYAGYGYPVFIACGGYAALTIIGLFSAVKSASGARK